jgi:hypothetical protein
MKFNDLIEIASELTSNSKLTAYNGRVAVTYTLPPALHAKMNEELYIRTKANQPDTDLVYEDVIEATFGVVDFVFIKPSEDDKTV